MRQPCLNRRWPIHIRREPDELLSTVNPPPQSLGLLRPPVHAHVAEQRLGLIELLPRRFEIEREINSWPHCCVTILQKTGYDPLSGQNEGVRPGDVNSNSKIVVLEVGGVVQAVLAAQYGKCRIKWSRVQVPFFTLLCKGISGLHKSSQYRAYNGRTGIRPHKIGAKRPW